MTIPTDRRAEGEEFIRRRNDEVDGFRCPAPTTCQFPRCDCGNYVPDSLVERIRAYDASDGGHSDAAGASAYELLNEAVAEISALSAQLAEAQAYATRLATTLWEKHWKQDAPEWQPLPELIGVLTQIDNACAGLVRSEALAEAQGKIERMRALLHRYRHETPLGHQPHMIAHEVDAERNALRGYLAGAAANCNAAARQLAEARAENERYEAQSSEVGLVQLNKIANWLAQHDFGYELADLDIARRNKAFASARSLVAALSPPHTLCDRCGTLYRPGERHACALQAERSG